MAVLFHPGDRSDCAYDYHCSLLQVLPVLWTTARSHISSLIRDARPLHTGTLLRHPSTQLRRPSGSTADDTSSDNLLTYPSRSPRARASACARAELRAYCHASSNFNGPTHRVNPRSFASSGVELRAFISATNALGACWSSYRNNEAAELCCMQRMVSHGRFRLQDVHL